MNVALQCKIEGCTKKGVSIYCRLCNYHWEQLIEKNVKEYIKEQKGVKL